MSRFLIIGDVHCRPDNLDKVHKLFQLVESKELPVIWLGDLLDTKDIVRAQCLNAYIHYFQSSQLNHIVICGNHDAINAEAKEFALEPLKLLKNVTVVDKPHVSQSILFLPYYRNPEEFRAVVSHYRDAQVLFMHQDIINMDYGNGYISTEGNALNDLKAFKLVISGHYHSYQDKDNLTYLGTPFSQNFGESNQDKFVGVFNEEDNTFCTIQTKFPKHITIQLDARNPHQFEVNPQDHVRIILRGTQEQLNAFNMDSLSAFKVVKECITNESKSKLKETETPETTFSKWYHEVKQGEDDTLLTIGLEILRIVK